jgi:endonuclease-3
MTIVEKRRRAIEIRKILDELFPTVNVPLNHNDPYTLLIAVLLSAQCTEERVNKVTPALFSLASNPMKMMKIPVEKIDAIVKPCGLASRKAPAIKKLSEILVSEYHGEVPKSLTELEKLPGVGHKTASVVMSQAFGVPSFPVDTHIHRLAQRWGLSSGKNVETTERDLKKLFPESSWNKVHLQMIYYGRKYCKARGHSPDDCIICSRFGNKLKKIRKA